MREGSIFSIDPIRKALFEDEPIDFAERGETGGSLLIAFARGVDDEGPTGGGEVEDFSGWVVLHRPWPRSMRATWHLPRIRGFVTGDLFGYWRELGWEGYEKSPVNNVVSSDWKR